MGASGGEEAVAKWCGGSRVLSGGGRDDRRMGRRDSDSIGLGPAMAGKRWMSDCWVERTGEAVRALKGEGDQCASGVDRGGYGWIYNWIDLIILNVQAWPITCVVGCLLGCATGHLYAIGRECIQWMSKRDAGKRD